MKTTLMTVTAGVAALSVLVAANSFASSDVAVSSLSAAADSITNTLARPFAHQGDRELFGKDVTIGNVVALDNGFTAEITSTDADTVASLQERAADGEIAKFLGKFDANVQTNVSNIDAGVKVTATSSNADTAAKLVEISAKLKEGKGFGMGMHQGMMDDTTRTVIVLDNGYSVEISAKDASDTDAIDRIRDREASAPQGTDNNNQDIVRVVENTAAGVKVTVTSANADTAARLVEIGTAMKDGKMPMGGHGGFGKEGFMMDSTNTVTVLDNGFVMEVSAKDATDADAIAKIQERAAEMNGKVPGEFMGVDTTSVTHTVENTAAGVKVTVTSSDAAIAAKLVEIGTAMKDGKMMPGMDGKGLRGHGGPRGDMGFFDKDATRTVTTLSNGYIVEISAKDATDTDAIAKIQEHEANAPKGPEGEDSKVVRTVENTAAGVKVTVTSADADTAAKLVAQAGRMQERETRAKEMKSDRSGDRESGNRGWGRGNSGGRGNADDADNNSDSSRGTQDSNDRSGNADSGNAQ